MNINVLKKSLLSIGLRFFADTLYPPTLKLRRASLIPLLLWSAITIAQPKMGEKAPVVELRDINNKVRRLTEYSGKVVLVDFWASWCVPCRKANPNLVRLYQKYNSMGFEIYSVSIDESKPAWTKAVVNDKMTWTQVIEPGGWDGKVATAWKIEIVPTSYLLDKSGKIAAVDLFGNKLEHKIAELLKK